jgi:hypothetical protein
MPKQTPSPSTEKWLRAHTFQIIQIFLAACALLASWANLFLDPEKAKALPGFLMSLLPWATSFLLIALSVLSYISVRRADKAIAERDNALTSVHTAVLSSLNASGARHGLLIVDNGVGQIVEVRVVDPSKLKLE